MALKIRLRQQGRKNRPSFRLVLADARFPRDGKYLETLGWYEPCSPDNAAKVDGEKISYWIGKGAQLTEPAKHLIKRISPDVIKMLSAKKNAKKVKAEKAEKAPAVKAAPKAKAKAKAPAAKGEATEKKAAPKKRAVKKTEGKGE